MLDAAAGTVTASDSVSEQNPELVTSWVQEGEEEGKRNNMEYGYKMRVAFAIASLAVVSIYFTARYRSRRKKKYPPSLCYLHADPKPQYAFKRVLADNSYAVFKHLKLNNSSSSDGTFITRFMYNGVTLFGTRETEGVIDEICVFSH